MGSHDGTLVPLPDALIERAEEFAPDAGKPAIKGPRLVLVPQQLGEADGCAVVDAPSGLAGFLLVMSLSSYRARNVQGDDGSWRVSVELGDGDALANLIEAVEQWLRRERIATTDIRVGERVQRLTAAT